jgi:hypothetical protein
MEHEPCFARATHGVALLARATKLSALQGSTVRAFADVRGGSRQAQCGSRDRFGGL